MSTPTKPPETADAPAGELIAGELKTTTPEGPKRNGLGTYLGLLLLLGTALSTGAAVIAGDAETARLTGTLGVVVGVVTQIGKFGQAIATIAKAGQGALPALEALDLPGFTRKELMASPPPGPVPAPPAPAPIEAEETDPAVPYPPTDVPLPSDEEEFASPPPPADEGIHADDEDPDPDDVVPVSVPDFAEEPGETERPESGVVPDQPAEQPAVPGDAGGSR